MSSVHRMHDIRGVSCDSLEMVVQVVARFLKGGCALTLNNVYFCPQATANK